MKKFVFVVLFVVSTVLFAGCGEQLLLDVIGEYGGEAAREMFEEEIEQNQKEYVLYQGGQYLVSYGNMISFTSEETSDGVYTATYAHLSGYSDELNAEIADLGNTMIPKTSTKEWGYKKCKDKGGIQTNSLISGRKVKKGELLGYIGKTGNASGIHLHFELKRDGIRIDPTEVIEGLTQ